MKQTIQNEITKLLSNLIIYENNKILRNKLISDINNILIKYNKKFLVVCDESNNNTDNAIIVDLYVYITKTSLTNIKFYRKFDKIKISRKMKLEKILNIT